MNTPMQASAAQQEGGNRLGMFFPQELCRQRSELLPRAQELQIQTWSEVDSSLAFTHCASTQGLSSI